MTTATLTAEAPPIPAPIPALALRGVLLAGVAASAPTLRAAAAVRLRLIALENAHGYIDALIMDVQMLDRNPMPSVQMRSRLQSNLANLDHHLAQLTPDDALEARAFRAAVATLLHDAGLLYASQAEAAHALDQSA